MSFSAAASLTGAPAKTGVILAGAAPRARMHLRRLLASIPNVEVLGHAQSAAQLSDLLQKATPDLIIIDAAENPVAALEFQPATGGSRATTVVLVEADRSIMPPNSGRTQFLKRPAQLELVYPNSPFCQSLGSLISRLESGSDRKVSTGISFRQRSLGLLPPSLIAIGSSTGGPQALPLLLAPLGTRIRQPIVITQHMPPTFTQLLAEHLGRSTSMPTVQAADGMPLLPGRIHIAPGGRHLLFVRKGDQVVCSLDDGPPENFCKPAVDPMLRSVVEIFGGRVLAVILTGMGHDGLAGCRALIDAGGAVLAQDEESSVVWGMPGAVAQAGLCQAVLPPAALADKILSVAGARP